MSCNPNFKVVEFKFVFVEYRMLMGDIWLSESRLVTHGCSKLKTLGGGTTFLPSKFSSLALPQILLRGGRRGGGVLVQHETEIMWPHSVEKIIRRKSRMTRMSIASHLGFIEIM